jgi:hypothetical protein
MPKMFQIHEEDLSELERILPQLAQVLAPSLNNRVRIQLRRTQTILSQVRWNYGPPSEMKVIPANEP